MLSSQIHVISFTPECKRKRSCVRVQPSLKQMTKHGWSSINIARAPRWYHRVMVSCFLTPSVESQYTFPPALRNEVEDVVGEYLFDCTEFRTEDKVDLLRQIYEMTDKRFKLADHLLSTKPWDLFAMVEMGTDRIHHGFWKDMDAEHRKHVPGGAYENAILDYHVHVDGLLANLLRHADDETAVLVVSDHGAKRMDGGIRINEWLRQGGPARPRARARGPLEHARLRHRLVAHEGLGRGRLLLPRLPQRRGARAERDDPARPTTSASATSWRRASARSRTSWANPIPTKVFRPEDVYPEIKGIAPDLIVHFGDLYWRAVGTVGGDEGLHTFDNDTGPDDANHAQHGMFILRAPGIEPGLREGAHLLDIAPTVLELLGPAGAARDARRESPGAGDGMSAELSPREREVLERAAFGRSNGQIAAELGVTVNTVKFHLASIFRKLGVANRTAAATAYVRMAVRDEERLAP